MTLRRFLPLLALLGFCSAAAAQTNPTAHVQDTLAQRMQACVGCHGKEGVATTAGYFPRIAGKPAGYLHEQLQNFQSGRRRYVPMNHLVAFMSDDYLRDIARYFAELQLPHAAPQPATLTAEQARTAQALVQRGVPERQIPACTACHGDGMAGRLPAMPGLLSLPADYLVGQLGAWRTGQRKAREPDCMAQVAQRLTVEEIGLVARWLSSQPVPAGSVPEAASTAALPIRCGSGRP